MASNQLRRDPRIPAYCAYVARRQGKTPPACLLLPEVRAWGRQNKLLKRTWHAGPRNAWGEFRVTCQIRTPAGVPQNIIRPASRHSGGGGPQHLDPGLTLVGTRASRSRPWLPSPQGTSATCSRTASHSKCLFRASCWKTSLQPASRCPGHAATAGEPHVPNSTTRSKSTHCKIRLPALHLDGHCISI